MFFYDIFP